MSPTAAEVQATQHTYQNQHLGALHVSDERHRVVYRQAPCAVAMRHEGRHPAGTAITHWQVDHQVKLFLFQEVSQMIQLPTRRVNLFKSPLHGLHLQS